jgi:hypothetical protein
MLAAVARGLLRMEAAPPWVLDDAFALVLVGPAWQELRDGPVSLFPAEVFRQVLAGVCTRSRYAEDRLATGAFAQYVIPCSMRPAESSSGSTHRSRPHLASRFSPAGRSPRSSG